MYRGTTPTIILNVRTNLDLKDVSECHVMIRSDEGYTSILYDDVRLDTEKKIITFQMSQEDTLRFEVGRIKIQVKMKLKNGSVIASKIINTEMKKSLEEIII